MANRVWKDGTRRGIAYVEGRAVAERIMVLVGRRRENTAAAPIRRRLTPSVSQDEAALEGAMAVYSDRRGRPFAWQIPFEIGKWDQVAAVVSGTSSEVI